MPPAVALAASYALAAGSQTSTQRRPAATVEGVRVALRAVPFDIGKARHQLNYAPHPIDAALASAVRSLLRRAPAGRRMFRCWRNRRGPPAAGSHRCLQNQFRKKHTSDPTHLQRNEFGVSGLAWAKLLIGVQRCTPNNSAEHSLVTSRRRRRPCERAGKVQDDPQAPVRRIAAILTKEKPKDRQAPQSGAPSAHARLQHERAIQYFKRN